MRSTDGRLFCHSDVFSFVLSITYINEYNVDSNIVILTVSSHCYCHVIFKVLTKKLYFLFLFSIIFAFYKFIFSSSFDFFFPSTIFSHFFPYFIFYF